MEMENIETLRKKRKYLLDVSLDGNNGEGDDGFENYQKRLEEVDVIDRKIRQLEMAQPESA